MKKILLILRSLPYPVDRDGLSVINYRLLSMSPMNYKFDIISLSEENGDTISKTKIINEHIDQVIIIPDKAMNSSFGRLFRLIKRFLGFRGAVYDEYICKHKKKYDLVYVCVPPSVLYLSIKDFGIPTFVNAVDSFSMLNLRFYNYHKTIFGGVKYYLYRKVEKKCFKYPDVISFVSSVDTEFSKKFLDRLNVVTIHNGVDCIYYNYNRKIEREKNSLLFVGNYRNVSNAIGVNNFVKNIFPLIKKVVPEVKLYIVGPHANFSFDDPNVIVTGFVDDLRDYYGKCTVFIAPLLTGSGIKNKVLEAMAAGIPVISSSIGIDGIDVENGYHLLVADEVTQWRDMIVDLLNNSQKRDYLANNAQIYVKDNYDWNTVIEQYFSQFSSLLK